MRRAGIAGTAAALLAASPSPGVGQHASARRDAPSVLFAVEQARASEGPPPWMPPVASLVAPGSGQLLVGADRGVVYLFAEVVLVAAYASAQHAGRRHRHAFKDLAFDVARAPFDPTVADTAFQYFEQMERFVASGPFDADSRPGLQPATDVTTYNGSIWALARRNFFADPDIVPDPTSPEYVRALEFYRRRAVGPNFLWTWQGASLEHDLFRQAVRQSNDAFRRGSRALGFLLANHLVSALDAFISGRLASPSPAAILRTRVVDRADTGLGPMVEWSLEVAF